MIINFRSFTAFAVYAFVGLHAPIDVAAAQDVSSSDEEEQVLDTVTVTGVQQDAAMAAFRAGDYKTAEVEFLDNAQCALRRERNLVASVETAQIDSARAETFANSVGANSGANRRGAGAGARPSSPTGLSANTGVSAKNIQPDADRTCDHRGFQMYMAGLSQIQLGKTDAALRNFERATVSSKVLYDAHYKIGLIKLLQGDVRTASQELKKIERILERCRKCDARKEIVERRDHLSKAIKGDVKLN